MFVDKVSIKVSAGRGGDGCVSFLREKFVPKGGPDGGDGGRGGSIFLVATDGMNTLESLSHRKSIRAQNGRPGAGDNCTGANAEDMFIPVPVGTVVRDADNDFILQDLVKPGDKVNVAKGGIGGKGNVRFKTAQNRAPRICTPGTEGEQRTLILELKVIADVGLVGKPNAGKSTLLSRLSSARPEIASYPFTTKIPNLGRVQIDFDHAFFMADIPGLIEGASQGVGLGHEFLRHIERAGIIVHLVEPDPLDGTTALDNYKNIRKELELYKEELCQRPEILVVTKAELPGAQDVQKQLEEYAQKPVLLISSVTGQGLNELKRIIGEELQKAKQAPVEEEKNVFDLYAPFVNSYLENRRARRRTRPNSPEMTIPVEQPRRP